MERKTLALLGLGLVVLAATVGAGCTNTSAPCEDGHQQPPEVAPA